MLADPCLTGVDTPSDKCRDVTGRAVDTHIEKVRPLHYSVSENPPAHLLGLFALQQALLAVSAPLGVSIVVAEVVCAQRDEPIKAQILSASMLMCGVATFLMNTFGVRLPIFQGPTAMYIVPLLVMSSSAEWECPATYEGLNPTDNSSILLAQLGNSTVVPARQVVLDNIARTNSPAPIFLPPPPPSRAPRGGPPPPPPFPPPPPPMCGPCRYIGPVTIVPTIVLVGLFLFKVLVKFSRPSWLVASATSACNLVLSLFLAKKKTPIPFWSPEKGFHIFWFPAHTMFSVMLSLLLGWALSAVLTVSGFFTDDASSEEYLARTDAKGDIIARASFLDVPYPGTPG
ncbi:hypothetical protein EGW08_016382, partial [Elysia chlorotica]